MSVSQTTDLAPRDEAVPTIHVELQREAPAPLHEQISVALRRNITRGAWPPHMRLPAEPDLADALAVSRGTIRRALRTLIEEGLLVQVRGRGTFVGSIVIEQPIAQELLSLSEGLAREGIEFQTEVISAAVAPAPARIAALLEIAADEPVFDLRRRRSIGGVPVAVLHNFVRRSLCPGIEANDFRHETMFGLLERVYKLRIANGRRTFEAQAADGDVATALGLETHAPVLYLEQLIYLDDGRPLEYSDVWIRSDQLKLSSVLSRPAPS